MIETGMMVDVLIQQRELELRDLALRRAARAAYPERERRHSLREWLGHSLIQVGRALLRRQSVLATATRRAA
jgi:hypothetical protein